jgi:hypothetical protein
MIDEGALERGAMGFILGLGVFVGGLVSGRYSASRKRQSSPGSDAGAADDRYSPGQVAPSLGAGLRSALQHLLVLGHGMYLLVMLFFVALLVAPRLRIILGVGVITVIGCSCVWFKVASWLARR